MEKQAEVTQLEHINTTESTSTPPNDKLEAQQTLQYVDIENRHAFKGDDSDGKIEWNIRKLFASAFLAMLYTGNMFSGPVSTHRKSLSTIADTSGIQGRKSFSTLWEGA